MYELVLDCAKVEVLGNSSRNCPTDMTVTLTDVSSDDIDDNGEGLLVHISDDKIMQAIDLDTFCDKFEDEIVAWIKGHGYTVEM